MTVALRPQDFADDDTAADGSGWEIAGEVFLTNPKRLVRPEDREAVRWWSTLHSGGMGGLTFLPEAGGLDDQAAVNMDAIAILSDQKARLTPKPAASRES